MSVVPVLVPVLLPESLLQTNRFPGFSTQTINRFAVYGDAGKSSMPESIQPIWQENAHNGVCH